MGVTLLASSKTHYTPSPGKQCKFAGQSVKALPIRILTVGKKRAPGVQLIVDEYIEKLKHYCPVDDVRQKSNPKNARIKIRSNLLHLILLQLAWKQRPQFYALRPSDLFVFESIMVSGYVAAWFIEHKPLQPPRHIDVMAQIEHEDMAVMGVIKSNEWVVMLDECGLDLGSEQMASLIGDAGNTGASSILFCIGGPYGHGRQLRERADVSIRLSSLVLNHEVALIVLAEQLYRAWTILKGQKYHH